MFFALVCFRSRGPGLRVHQPGKLRGSGLVRGCGRTLVRVYTSDRASSILARLIKIAFGRPLVPRARATKFKSHTLCYAIVLPVRKSAFRAGLWPDCYRESAEIGSPVGLRPAGGPISFFS